MVSEGCPYRGVDCNSEDHGVRLLGSGSAEPDRLADRPDESSELAREGGHDDLVRFASSDESSVPLVETVLGNPADPA